MVMIRNGSSNTDVRLSFVVVVILIVVGVASF